MIASVERQMYYNNITAQHSFLIDEVIENEQNSNEFTEKCLTDHTAVIWCHMWLWWPVFVVLFLAIIDYTEVQQLMSEYLHTYELS